MQTPLTVFSPLRSSDWRPGSNGTKGWWHCRMLDLPGAEFESVWIGRQGIIQSEYYELRGSRLHWKGADPPPSDVQIELRLRRHLVARRTWLMLVILCLFASAFLSLRHAEALPEIRQTIAQKFDDAMRAAGVRECELCRFSSPLSSR
jgi:hypothetical protein